jgi:mono/diheme cytochrome c family protein
MVVLIGMPFIDRTRERRLSRRPIAVGFAGAMAVLLLGLTWYGSKAPGAAVAGTTTIAFTANLPCASCHVLKEASGWNGNVGPNLDSKKPTYALALDRITNGKGVMPSFKSTFSAAKIKCIAAFVATESRGGSDTAKLGGSPGSPADLCKGIT